MFIISICIPTFNRSKLLAGTIESIVSQDRFINSDDVQIIISDNCSTDDTQEVCLMYYNIFSSKIVYNRNISNINDENFGVALSLGTGLYLKLNNDTLVHEPGSLDSMINFVLFYQYKKPILYFSNGFIKNNNNDITICENFSAYIMHVGIWTTYVGSFGIWMDHYKNIKNFSRRASLQLPHTDTLFRSFEFSSKAVIVNYKYFTNVNRGIKGGYDMLTVFMENYLFLLREQHEIGFLNTDAFQHERSAVLIKFIRPWILDTLFYPKMYNFTFKNAPLRILKFYRGDGFLLLHFIFRFFISLVKGYLIKFLKAILRWRYFLYF